MTTNPFLEKCNTWNENWPEWRKNLYNNGWAIIPNLVAKEKAAAYKEEFWTWVEQNRNRARRNDPSTWTEQNMGSSIYRGIIHDEIAHTQWMWDIRSEDAILDVFTQVYGTDKLLVSFDGANISRPLEEKEALESWAHFDQGHLKYGFQCVQGLLNLEHCGETDGGLVVLEGSHQFHDEYFKTTGIETESDWYPFEDEDVTKLDLFKNCKKIKVCCKPGDFVVWDSRTVHWACSPIKGPNKKCRMVTYVSMQPAEIATPETIEAKQMAFKTKRNTSHWASTNIDFFGIERGQVNNIPLTPRIEKLAGLVPY
ncbi:hypothetical protein CYY_008274 [Polysphondylium violaceum]|uniref:Phytanoyl-CoA dioxygenase n=1 Tax=Polysphondylium violaceum TaxID=133409 RepID=A0A8J4PNC2_9MYCE|nr:hypothetical protein CYY_008274 [Polysphondylium violaceum]